MNLVRLALRRPLTIVVGVIAVALGAWIALQRMTRDVFPPLGIPTIYVAQPFGGDDVAAALARAALLRAVAAQPAEAFHPRQHGIQRAGADFVAVVPQLLQHPVADNPARVLGGVVEDVNLPERQQNLTVNAFMVHQKLWLHDLRKAA